MAPLLRAIAIASLAWSMLCAPGCRSGEATQNLPRRDCAYTVWFHETNASARAFVVTSWNSWQEPGIELATGPDGWRFTTLDPPPGEGLYAVIEDGVWAPDPDVGTTAFYDGHEVTWRDFGDCRSPALQVNGVTVAAGIASVRATFVAGAIGEGLDVAAITLAETSAIGDVSVPDFRLQQANASTGVIELSLSLPVGKHRLTLTARDANRLGTAEAIATVFVEPVGNQTWDWRDAVIYQVMIDRFRASDGSALASPATPSSRAGGTLRGVREALISGELQALGVNTLWLSPLYDNPDGVFPGTDGRPYSSYHGYWPIQSRALEPLLGSEADLDTLIANAHSRGIRVLFDVVPNHVHQQHPYYAMHRAEGWFSHPEGGCVCGTATCPWSTHIEDCWFAPYLPDFDWTRGEVATQVTDDVRWWLDRFDGDGIRIDAVPMMPRAANRRIADAIRTRYAHDGYRPFLLGENFVGGDGWDALRYQLGPSGLDSEFDFPMMWALRSAIAEESAPMSTIDVAIRTSIQAFDGSGAVMTAMIGNHDVPRFSSLSAGDAGGDGFDPAPQSTDETVYAKQEMALALLYTLPEAPVVYYGDEVGLAGGGDPDSRRIMPSEAELGVGQRAVRDLVRLLGRTRRCSTALRRGTYRMLAADNEHLVFVRQVSPIVAGDDPVVVSITRKGSAAFVLGVDGLPRGEFTDVVSGEHFTLGAGNLTLPKGDRSIRVLLPSASACTTAK